jgi:DNA-binding NarL/FixJ family response regulator
VADDDQLLEAIRLGAQGIVLKDMAPGDTAYSDYSIDYERGQLTFTNRHPMLVSKISMLFRSALIATTEPLTATSRP